MHLKSITLKGFKSFPDRTRLEFAPGVSVIVGPNGSGKSNVTDAVLWALGEQSPLAVRGQSMQDVIFGGAPGRQAAKGAEVELVLDDSDGELGLGVSEVSLLRRLHRTGEGEYRIAGARCRLIDVIELLSDTGLGKEMHSVISQGRVESIVTSKPRDRRLLIEEAAGLGKHRKRRRRAQLKLARTQENLDRGLDLEREARSRLRPLKRQSEAADLHARLERQTLEVRWELARDDLRLRHRELELAEQTAAGGRERRAEVQRRLHAVAARREAAEEELTARGTQREELSRRCFAAQSAAERVSYRTEALRATAATLEQRSARGRDALHALQAQALADADAPPVRSAARATQLEAELAALDRDREAELDRQLAELERQRLAAATELRTLEATAAERRLERTVADERVEQARRGLREAERAVESTRREAAAAGAELAGVNQFLRSQAGAPGGGAALADELAVAPGYELAVTAALDGRLRAAVVPNRAAAAALLDRVGADGGRVLVVGTSVEATSVRPGAVEPPSPASERLRDRVLGPSEAAKLARALLLDVWVVDDLDRVEADFSGIAVTRSGRVYSPSTREVRQAPEVGEDRILAQRNQREDLIRASERAVQRQLAAAGAHERAAEAVAHADIDRDQALEADRAADREREDAAERERRIARVIESRRAAPDEGPEGGRRSQLAAELAAERGIAEQAARERAERERRIVQLGTQLASDEEFRPALHALIEVLTRGLQAIGDQRQAFQAALVADREAGEHVASALRTCAHEEAMLQSKLAEENESLTAAEVSAQRIRDQAVEAEAEVGGLASKLELASDLSAPELGDTQRRALAERLERLVRRREQIGPVNPLAQQQYQVAVEHVEELERQRNDLEAALRELEKLITDTDRQIRDTFEATFQAAAANFEGLVERLFPGGHGRLALVSERDGPRPVLGGQTPPGEDGDSEELEPETDTADAEDLLGVEIEITPGGKAMKRLSLLSGGEKSMTALAFLFSVFLARPCPFYILDEVEAALDDLNIDRFLELLRCYSGQAQFIVVTHQKRTMEAADSLYGVSMGADGVSKVISRRLPREAEAA